MRSSGMVGSEAFRYWLLGILLLVPLSEAVVAQDATPQQVFDRAVRDFEAGRIEAAATGFDEVIRLAPNAAPTLWQRGIALYYARRWEDCRAQFELHRTVNPNDVENAVWHYICVAQLESPDQARRRLLPVGPDERVPMAQIYQLFRGAIGADEVLASADSPQAEFYAHLYVGLFFESEGDPARALGHIRMAASDPYRAVGNYMHMVARVHLALATR